MEQKGPSIESQKNGTYVSHISLNLSHTQSNTQMHTLMRTHTHTRTRLHHSFLLRSKVNIVPPSSQLSCALDCIECQHWQNRLDI